MSSTDYGGHGVSGEKRVIYLFTYWKIAFQAGKGQRILNGANEKHINKIPQDDTITRVKGHAAI